jgi:hypothetical protein
VGNRADHVGMRNVGQLLRHANTKSEKNGFFYGFLAIN